MNKKITGGITIVLLLLSPLLGGILGRLYATFFVWMDDIFCYITIFACIIACIIFYLSFSDSKKIDI